MPSFVFAVLFKPFFNVLSGYFCFAQFGGQIPVAEVG